jgi:D-glycero-D-manno-heptose 1,7-bisphosphate phosphatase
MKNKGVLLDRDGTINVDKGYVHRIKDFKFMAGAIEAIKLLNDGMYTVIVITNQSGIGRGYYTEDDVNKLHEHINNVLAEVCAKIDAFYFCPHHPSEAVGRYRQECNCRKPKTGLFEQAITDFDLDVKYSYAIGNNAADIEAGHKAGLVTIFIGRDTNCGKIKSEFTTPDVLGAVKLILRLDQENSER